MAKNRFSPTADKRTMTELFGPCDRCGRRFKTLIGLVNHPCPGKKANRPRRKYRPHETYENTIGLGP